VLVVWSMLSHQAPPATALFEGARTELCSVCEVAWMDGKPLKKLARETGLEPRDLRRAWPRGCRSADLRSSVLHLSVCNGGRSSKHVYS
jgi:hypothetical protein